MVCKTYKAVVAYDGTDFFGWQVQPTHKTIAGTLQDTFKSVFKKSITIIGSSRTDAGVHALGQVFRVITDIAVDATTMQMAWNASLPQAIQIRSLVEVAETFHPQKRVDYKLYSYRLYTKKPLPFAIRYGVFVENFDYEKLCAALAVMRGTHDFRPLSVEIPLDRPTIRTIDAICVYPLKSAQGYRIVVRGRGFLRYMVRRVVGAALECARGRCTVEYIEKVLQEGIVENHLPVAPAAGLCLIKVVYKKDTL